MTTAAPSTALVMIQPAFTDAERLALAGFLAGYRGLTREAYALDLRQFTTWCRARSLALFAVRRADIESFARELEAKGRARATVTRRLCTGSVCRPCWISARKGSASGSAAPCAWIRGLAGERGRVAEQKPGTLGVAAAGGVRWRASRRGTRVCSGCRVVRAGTGGPRGTPVPGLDRRPHSAAVRWRSRARI